MSSLGARAARRSTIVLFIALSTLGCAPEPYVWDLPMGFPAPRVPDDNPMREEKVELGRYLFYDSRLSGNETQACASCHLQALAFTDGLAHAVGSTGEVHPRSSMSLANAAYVARLNWASAFTDTLEEQAPLPMFGENPVELGLVGHEEDLVARLRADERYPAMFRAAFPEDGDPVTVHNVVRALASFERALISGSSPYDRYVYRGELDAMSDAALRGRALFESDRLGCARCHAGFGFSDAVRGDGAIDVPVPFHNTGLYNVDGLGGYPAPNRGLYEQSGVAADMGRFRTPTLRNVARTAPYMHDGSVSTLEEVLDHYAAGGRTIADGPNAGVGADSPLRDPLITGFTLSAEERADLLVFLESLTDEAFLSDPRLADPFSP